MRFLTDHLQGDTYFKIHREGHNLDRCRTQLRLVADMEKKADEMEEIVRRYAGTARSGESVSSRADRPSINKRTAARGTAA